ncbi:hypothetical protein BGV40_02600 [Methanosarcina sp. Ant1]|nr:hypothetical protein BGV40_02600 [Methanosarcina sp. Ant1]
MLTGFKSIYFIKCSKNGIPKNILIPYVDLFKVGLISVLYLFLRFLFDQQQNDPHRHINMQMLHRTLDQSENNQLRTVFMQSS